jgi:hypothetical protein
MRNRMTRQVERGEAKQGEGGGGEDLSVIVDIRSAYERTCSVFI